MEINISNKDRFCKIRLWYKPVLFWIVCYVMTLAGICTKVLNITCKWTTKFKLGCRILLQNIGIMCVQQDC